METMRTLKDAKNYFTCHMVSVIRRHLHLYSLTSDAQGKDQSNTCHLVPLQQLDFD